MKPTITGVGNLTKDVVLEQTSTGKPVAKFTVAFNGSRDANDTTFLWCVAYNKTAETIAKFLKKGSAIQIVGELSQYKDESGKSHTYCDVSRFGFIGSGSSNRESPPPTKQVQAPTEEISTEDDPF